MDLLDTMACQLKTFGNSKFVIWVADPGWLVTYWRAKWKQFWEEHGTDIEQLNDWTILECAGLQAGTIFLNS